MIEEENKIENVIYDLHICNICESSTDNPIFEIDGKRYCVCDTCYNVIRFIVEDVIDNSKDKK